jgi:coenzyme F420-reducing hydrogenase beta subunit
MNIVCEHNKCAGCMACVDACPKRAITIMDSLDACNAVIGEECIKCGLCHKICQWNYPSEFIKPMYWYQGWTNDNEIRMKGSSGGCATALAKAFIELGGEVCSCVFDSSRFAFKVVNTVMELEQFAGSKYVKSDPGGIYQQIKNKLRDKKKVLFIALPCQVSALKNYVGKELCEDLYTVDLICHGTPSPQILDIFLKQYGLRLNDIKDICFRNKGSFQIVGDYKGVVTPGISDRYMISFLSSLTYSENCYDCQYARTERVSDITLGDSWGSELPTTEWKNGISLILCQTEKGKLLLDNADLHLEPVDLKKAIERNHQLEYPSNKPQNRDSFFAGIKKGKKFNVMTLRCMPHKCIRQDLKQILIKLFSWPSV